jgi:two-component sensor histidine kinase
MKRSTRQKAALYFAIAATAAAIIGGARFYFQRAEYNLPYRPRFAADAEDRWTALGGTWEVVDGSMRNDSNDRGAKLLTGSPNWKDYAVEADVQLLGAGSVGVLARVSDAEIGENSHKGYFAGVRTVDNSLVLGSFDFAYHEAARVTLPEPVRPFRWYHVRLSVKGCMITTSASAAGMSEIKTLPVNDPDCFRSGVAGLRSNGTGGVWRNVTVLPADASAATAGLTAQNLPLPDTTSLQRASLQNRTQSAARVAPAATQSINSLLNLDPFRSPTASVRGTVVLTRPAVFVQDSTGGGVEVVPESETPLKIGDEVEVTGEVELDKVNPVLRKARFRLLREAVPISPLALTANQLAEGHYDGMFVQVEGYLRSISNESEGRVSLRLDGGAQTFHVIAAAGRSWTHLHGLALNSRLRLKGISVGDPRFNKDADPFVILARSTEDVDVLAGPPWWRPSTLTFLGLAALALLFTINHLYLLLKHWRLRAVAEERERLAHEIHDTLAQSFAGIGFQLQAIRNSMPRDAQVLERQVDLAMAMARTSHEEARRSIATLRPESLGHIPLLTALRDCAERMVKSGNVTVETWGEEDGRQLALHIKDALFRIGQEAIANSIRHADPQNIRIKLQQQRTSLWLLIEDDGHGFMVDSEHAGFGLRGMRKRAESISATLLIKSSPGAGTRVEVKVATGSRFLALAWRRSGALKHLGASS